MKAALWQRVSTGAQDEASQLPDLVQWCKSHDYATIETYVVHGKSAFHGKHQEALDQAFSDMAAGKYEVLVVWAADRIERRGALAALTLAERARQAGGRIEYVKDAHLNQANDMSDTMLAIAGDVARLESKRKSERVKAKQASLRAAGSVVGRAAWGYTIEKRDGLKVLVPTQDGRNYISLIFAMVGAGRSCRYVAEMLDEAGIKTNDGKPWNEGFICNRLIKNPTYYGRRPNSGVLETTPLVSYDAWLKANSVLASRAKPGRGAVVHAKALLKPVCGQCYGTVRGGCSNGLSAMYRVFVGDGRTAYYRCSGSGPQRKGCGAPMIPCDVLDKHVKFVLRHDPRPHVAREFVPGNDRSAEVGKLRQQAIDAYAAGDKATFRVLDAQADALESEKGTAPHWEERKTGQTEGTYFRGLDEDGQRAYLADWRPVVSKGDADGPSVKMDKFLSSHSPNPVLIMTTKPA